MAKNKEASDAAPHAAPKIVELDPVVWSRGPSEVNYLLRVDDVGRRRQCCIGVACSVFGVPDGAIMLGARLEDLSPDYMRPEFETVTDRRYDDDEGDWIGVSDERMNIVYALNDEDSAMGDAARVEALNVELQRIGAEFRFTLKAEGKV